MRNKTDFSIYYWLVTSLAAAGFCESQASFSVVRVKNVVPRSLFFCFVCPCVSSASSSNHFFHYTHQNI